MPVGTKTLGSRRAGSGEAPAQVYSVTTKEMNEALEASMLKYYRLPRAFRSLPPLRIEGIEGVCGRSGRAMPVFAVRLSGFRGWGGTLT